MSFANGPLRGVFDMVKKNGPKRNGGKGGKGGNGGARSKGVRISAPKRKSVARKAGAGRAPAGRKMALVSTIKNGLNAFHPQHIPLPVSTGSYFVITTRRTFETTDLLTLVGPQRLAGGVTNLDDWSSYCAVGASNGGNAMNGSATWKFKTIEAPFSTDGGQMECAPAAVSVQLMSGASLTSASGIVQYGRCKTGIAHPEATDVRTVNEFASALVSYSEPKVLPVAKLTMGAYQTNLIPSNLSELQDFEVVRSGADSTVPGPWTESNPFAGFCPAYIYNPSGAALTVTVAIEWRVRVSPFNPLHGSATTYPPTSPGLWHSIVNAANNSGHGVEEAGAIGGGAAALYASGAGAAMADAATSYAASVGGGLLASALEYAPLLALL